MRRRDDLICVPARQAEVEQPGVFPFADDILSRAERDGLRRGRTETERRRGSRKLTVRIRERDSHGPGRSRRQLNRERILLARLVAVAPFDDRCPVATFGDNDPRFIVVVDLHRHAGNSESVEEFDAINARGRNGEVAVERQCGRSVRQYQPLSSRTRPADDLQSSAAQSFARRRERRCASGIGKGGSRAARRRPTDERVVDANEVRAFFRRRVIHVPRTIDRHDRTAGDTGDESLLTRSRPASDRQLATDQAVVEVRRVLSQRCRRTRRTIDVEPCSRSGHGEVSRVVGEQIAVFGAELEQLNQRRCAHVERIRDRRCRGSQQDERAVVGAIVGSDSRQVRRVDREGESRSDLRDGADAAIGNSECHELFTELNLILLARCDGTVDGDRRLNHPSRGEILQRTR